MGGRRYGVVKESLELGRRQAVLFFGGYVASMLVTYLGRDKYEYLHKQLDSSVMVQP